MGLSELVAATTPARVGEKDPVNWHGLRDGAGVTIEWIQALILEGRGFLNQIGTEDAPVLATGSIDDQLAFGIVDVPAGTTAIPYFAQAVIGTWTTATLINFMIEIDNAAVRYSSGGAVFSPLNLRTDSPIASLAGQDASVFGCPGDIITTARGALQGLELFRESIEVNVGDAADYWPPFLWEPKRSPFIVGPGSFIMHLGSATADMTAYGVMKWIELDSLAYGLGPNS